VGIKRITLIAGGAALLLCTAACSKKIAAAPPPPAPAAAPVAVTPAPAKTGAAKPAPQQTSPRQAEAQVASRGNRITPQERATLNQILAKMEDALFDFDKTTIRADASTALKDDVAVIREILANYPNQKLIIEGHADERGSDEYNLALGDKRAHAVEEFLSSMGIPIAQLTLISYGKQRPVCTDETEACWQRNRRAHVTAAP
jgi:peptidoglycan-associated lipoprotein